MVKVSCTPQIETVSQPDAHAPRTASAPAHGSQNVTTVRNIQWPKEIRQACKSGEEPRCNAKTVATTQLQKQTHHTCDNRREQVGRIACEELWCAAKCVAITQLQEQTQCDSMTHRITRHSSLQLSHLLLTQLDIKSRNILFQIFQLLGPRDGEDIIPLVMHPSQGQLPCLAPLLLCQLHDLVNQDLILQSQT